MKTAIKYFKVWWMMSRNSFMQMFAQRFGAIFLLIVKVLRFIFYLSFIYFLLKGTETLAGYNINQTIFFFLTFSLVDTVSQFFFREVYRFRPMIVTGSFDLVLAKPISPLFRSLMGGADILDLITIPPLIIAVYLIGSSLHPSGVETVYFLLLFVNGLLIATAFHIAVISLGIITLEIDHTVMIYRDLTSLGRFPVDIYREPLRGFLTFLVPVGIMVTLPAKALMGLVNLQAVVLSFTLSLVLIFLSIKFWNFALTKYSSASS